MSEAILLLFALARMSLNSYFEYMRLAGKTEEEIEALYKESREAFMARPPEKLKSILEGK